MNNDDKVHALVSEFRFLTIKDLVELGCSQGVRRNLDRLVQQKKVFEFEPKSNNEPHVYAPHKLDRKSQERIPHDMLITRIHIALYLTGLLTFWAQGKTAWKGKIHQDGLGVLEHPRIEPPRNNFHYFIEADTGVESYQEIGKKLKDYNAYPDKPFRVLFVTSREGWARKLAKAAEQYVEQSVRKFYLFTQEQDFLSNPLGKVCFIPYELEPQAMLPKLI